MSHWTTSIYGLRIDFSMETLRLSSDLADVPVQVHLTDEAISDTKMSARHLRGLIQSFGCSQI